MAKRWTQAENNTLHFVWNFNTPASMSRLRSDDSRPPIEPDTESRHALLHWLGRNPGPRLTFLAGALGVAEQALCGFAERQARPDPESEIARLLAIVTQGAVPSLGWQTDDELEACRGARARAAEMAKALDALPQPPTSHAPTLQPLAARRRRSRGASAPRSSRLGSSAPLPSGAPLREAPLEPPRLTLLLGAHEPPLTERSDPPTQPSAPIRPVSTQSAARAVPVAIVEARAKDLRPSTGRHRNPASAPPSTLGRIAIADAIATLTQQGYSIRLEKKE